MPRRKTKLCAGEYYHFYNRGNNRDAIFYERENYGFFIRRLWKYLVPVLDVVAYCLMPNHYHLLVLVKGTKTSEVSSEQIRTTSEVSPVSRAMQRFSISYTKAMNKRYTRAGSLFQGAFQTKIVKEEMYLVHLSRYIHLNPVIAGLVEHPADWEFSSYCDYIGLREGKLPHPEVVLAQFPSREAYSDFVEEYVPSKREFIADLLFE